MRYSETRTVARIYTLRSWCSKPRDDNNENHAGLIIDPLVIAVSNGLPNAR